MKNGIVPVRLEEKVCASLRKFLGENAGAEVTVDLTANKVSTPIGEFAFSAPAFFREMLLEGVDEIGLTLSMLPKIEAFEKGLRRRHALAHAFVVAFQASRISAPVAGHTPGWRMK
jgi:3-isopropylmalate/(R)-2-methylmalate dehydratase small subunit